MRKIFHNFMIKWLGEGKDRGKGGGGRVYACCWYLIITTNLCLLGEQEPGKKWSEAAIKMLVVEYSNLFLKVKTLKQTKSSAMKAVSKILIAHGHNWSSQSASTKWGKMVTKYHEIIRHKSGPNSTGKGTPKKWEHFNVSFFFFTVKVKTD